MAAKGTAIRSGGKATAQRIVQAAQDSLSGDGIRDFTMRGIAKRAELRLANVQYYFPTMNDLILALIDFIVERYREAYAQIAKDELAPRDHLRMIVELNLEDITNISTRRLFINLWPLLETESDFTGDLTHKLYSVQFDLLKQRILAIHPSLPTEEAVRRAKVISALIEGLFVTLPPTRESQDSITDIRGRVLDLCLKIADGEA